MKTEMEKLEVAFKEVMSSEVIPMDEVLDYVSSVKGKRLRPSLVFLTAKLFGEINESTQRTALFVEMLHTATLIHDDVVDGSSFRRGQASVNARWDGKTAVLVGDYLLAKAMTLLSAPEDRLILKEMLDVAMMMSEGELLQSEELGVRSEEYYLGIIERKTARLMRACCLGGALSVTSHLSPLTSHLISDFGLNLGLVFQMRDDIRDADDADTVLMAKKLLPVYWEKTVKALDALEPVAKDAESMASLRALSNDIYHLV